MVRPNQVGCQARRVTSVVVWCGVDSRGPSSLYIATDSRLTWSRNGGRWDQGRKTFSCVTKPFIFGYWGDVLFPALALPLVQDQVDQGLVADAPGYRAHKVIGHAIRGLWSDYPDNQRNDIGIVIGSRAGERMSARFILSVMTYQALRRNWQLSQVPMPSRSGSLYIAGSGASEVRRTQELWEVSHAQGTSRAVYSSLCESLADGRDPQSGGSPQLVGIHRIGSGITCGSLHGNRTYVAGRSVARREAATLADVPWFNELFEIVDPKRRKRKLGAQKHLQR